MQWVGAAPRKREITQVIFQAWALELARVTIDGLRTEADRLCVNQKKREKAELVKVTELAEVARRVLGMSHREVALETVETLTEKISAAKPWHECQRDSEG